MFPRTKKKMVMAIRAECDESDVERHENSSEEDAELSSSESTSSESANSESASSGDI